MNPNIPWKTRGNGAISFQVGIGCKDKIKIGEIDGKDVFSSVEMQKDVKESGYKIIKKIIQKTISEYAKVEDENTNPGFVILEMQPDFKVYKKAVTQVVLLDEITDLLYGLNAEFKGYKNCRGLIGATSSVAWDSKYDKTYEMITYRETKKWGTKRIVDDESVKLMDKSTKTTFDNYDYKNNHNRVTPNSPCPILYGIRGDNSKELIDSSSKIKSETVDSWLIFETNQGTDDHLQRKEISEIIPFESVIVEGSVVKNPYAIKGGHVLFKIENMTGTIDCAAYEPTKEFRHIIRELCIGDVVEVYGGVRKKPLTVNIEKINIIKLKKIIEKIENPVCPKCGKHMKSQGKDQGFKCKICSIKSNDAFLSEKKRKVQLGFYEVPVCARRHLSKPIKRFKNNYLNLTNSAILL